MESAISELDSNCKGNLTGNEASNSYWLLQFYLIIINLFLVPSPNTVIRAVLKDCQCNWQNTGWFFLWSRGTRGAMYSSLMLAFTRTVIEETTKSTTTSTTHPNPQVGPSKQSSYSTACYIFPFKGIFRCKFNPCSNIPWNCVRLTLQRSS